MVREGETDSDRKTERERQKFSFFFVELRLVKLVVTIDNYDEKNTIS